MKNLAVDAPAAERGSQGAWAETVLAVAAFAALCVVVLSVSPQAAEPDDGAYHASIVAMTEGHFLTLSTTQAEALARKLGERAQAPADKAAELDQKLIAEAKAGSQIMANLKYLCDEIGPRLTGSPNLKRANQWAAERMKAYGLTNVHQEAWSMPEGWERGHARARILDPENGRTLDVASMGCRRSPTRRSSRRVPGRCCGPCWQPTRASGGAPGPASPDSWRSSSRPSSATPTS